MAIRNDFTITWHTSPRLITVAAPSTEVSMQDLVDTLRSMEDDLENLHYKKILNATGKQFLGGTTYVGITVELLDAQIAFEARSGPDWVLCNLNGGNLVAIDSGGSSMEVISPTAYVSVARTSSSSATTQGIAEIQQLSFNNQITVDLIKGNSIASFTADPGLLGNSEYPVNNFLDALTISDNKAISTLKIIGDAVIDVGDFANHEIIGSNPTRSTITLGNAANLAKVTITHATITGILDGDSHISNCEVGDLSYVNGTISNSGLFGTIALAGAEDALISNCYFSALGTHPVIDMGGGGQDLIITNWSGTIEIQNLTNSANRCNIHINGGKVKLDSSITAGNININGIGVLVDNATSYTKFIVEGLLNKTNISTAVWDESIADHLEDYTMGHAINHGEYQFKVVLNSVTGSSGTSYPIGTKESPVDNIADAVTIANAHNFNNIEIEGSYDITDGTDISNLNIQAIRSSGNSVTITNAVMDNCYFTDITVSGTMTGSARYTTCVLGVINNFDGGAKNCLLTGAISITGTGANYLTECDTYQAIHSFLSIDVGDKLVNLIRGRGKYEIINKTGAGVVSFDLVAGYIKVASSCTAGIVGIGGIAKVIDESGAGCTVNELSLNITTIVDGVWGHTDAIQLLADAVFIKNIEGGKWKILNNQMIFYKDDNTTEVARFNLLDQAGLATETDVRERVRV